MEKNYIAVERESIKIIFLVSLRNQAVQAKRKELKAVVSKVRWLMEECEIFHKCYS